MVKNLPAVRETWVWSLGGEDPLEKGMATHSSTLAWKIPWTEEPGRLPSMGSHRVGHDWSALAAAAEHWVEFPLLYSRFLLVTYFICACVLSYFSHVRLFVILWTVAHQAPLSVGFSKQEYWSWLPCPSPGDLPHPGIEPRSPALEVDSLWLAPPGKPTYFIHSISGIYMSIPISQFIPPAFHPF